MSTWLMKILLPVHNNKGEVKPQINIKYTLKAKVHKAYNKQPYDWGRDNRYDIAKTKQGAK